MVGAVTVEAYRVPDVFAQMVEDVNSTELPHRSLAGAGSVIHILKSQVATEPDDTVVPFVNTLTR
jgi:hypothetical protein